MSLFLEMSKTWAQADPIVPVVSTGMQPVLAFLLLFAGIMLTALFSLIDKRGISGLIKQFLLVIPASLAYGFGFVYLLCAVGVYV
ncbi:uncharacterized protein V1518DRAFT_421840 [Limtongia smithiae]|uniref:uncharacterized protein n=1 Tax=Limtongia smithiae TaxID=1125753 RepID=UPI0034CE57D3